MIYIVVGIAGVVGALLRYYLGLTVDLWWHQAFPLATLITNLIGCFVLGWLTTYVSRLNIFNPIIITALGTGLIGSFTTFSTFSFEMVQLMEKSHWILAFTYILISLWGGLFMAGIGYHFGKWRFLEYTNRKSSN